MLAWWAYTDASQEILSLDTYFDIEHIYARNRQEKEKGLTNPKNMESIGNKVLLESRINIRASDYKFSDKIDYYKGYINARGIYKEGTEIKELLSLAAEKTDFSEKDIENRNSRIINGFFEYLKENGLVK